MTLALDQQPAPSAATPATPDDLFRRFAALGIAVTTHEHEPVATVEEAKFLRGVLPGGHCKSLLLTDKRGALWLLVADEDRRVDLKALAKRLGAGRFSFASAERLMAALGVRPGAVTPFGLINDRAAQVQVVLDRDMLGHALLNYHPLVNHLTTAIGRDNLLRFLEAGGHQPHILGLAGDATAAAGELS